MDLSLPLLNGVQATRRIRHELPSTKILVLTSYGHDEYLRQALQAGAHGFLLKQTAADELLVAIRHVFDGNSYISKQLSKALARLASESERKRPAKSPSNLTLREGQILQLISDGFSNKQIGAQLGISVKTVEKHRQKLMNKLGIHETAGLTRYALALESL
jgi:DNA-binding NarL/FixJ family response regulator